MSRVLRKREGEKHKSGGVLASCLLSRWPLSLFLHRRMCLLATPSIMLTPAAEQHLFIRLDRWKRGRWSSNDEESTPNIIYSTRNYTFMLYSHPAVFAVSCSLHKICSPSTLKGGIRELQMVMKLFTLFVTCTWHSSLAAALCHVEGLSFHYIVLLLCSSTLKCHWKIGRKDWHGWKPINNAAYITLTLYPPIHTSRHLHSCGSKGQDSRERALEGFWGWGHHCACTIHKNKYTSWADIYF